MSHSTGFDDEQDCETSLRRTDSKLQSAIWFAVKRSQMELRTMSQSAGHIDAAQLPKPKKSPRGQRNE